MKRLVAGVLVCLAVSVSSVRSDEGDPAKAAEALVTAYDPCFFECYHEVLETQPELVGRMVFDFEVDAGGKIASGGVKAPTPEIEQCASALLGKLAFATAAAPVKVSRYLQLDGPRYGFMAYDLCRCETCSMPPPSTFGYGVVGGASRRDESSSGPQVRFGKVTSSDAAADPNTLRRYLRRTVAQLVPCHEGTGDLALTATYAVGRTGKVTKVTVEGNAPEKVRRCVGRVIRGIVHPRFAHRAVVTAPITLMAPR